MYVILFDKITASNLVLVTQQGFGEGGLWLHDCEQPRAWHFRCHAAFNHLPGWSSASTSSARVRISSHDTWISRDSVYLEQMANRRKYVSPILDGTRWITPWPLMRLRRVSFRSFEPCKMRHKWCC